MTERAIAIAEPCGGWDYGKGPPGTPRYPEQGRRVTRRAPLWPRSRRVCELDETDHFSQVDGFLVVGAGATVHPEEVPRGEIELLPPTPPPELTHGTQSQHPAARRVLVLFWIRSHPSDGSGRAMVPRLT
jgi:hypothetical protein